MAACPRLTELTVTPNPYDTRATETGVLHDPAGTVLSAISELVIACEALPDFDTLQILHVPAPRDDGVRGCGELWCNNRTLHANQWGRLRREQVGGLKDFTIDCLETLKSRRHKGEGRKRTIVRIVRMRYVIGRPDYLPRSVEVEEYEM